MAHTYSALYYHLVFSTKDRKPHIQIDDADRVWGYLGAIARAHRVSALAIGGIEDHVHMLLKAPPVVSPSDVVRTLKANSSKWIHQTLPNWRHFAWQDGYGIFAVSKSNVDAVTRYIRNQRLHHRQATFREEYERLLRAHEIEFDDSYLLG